MVVNIYGATQKLPGVGQIALNQVQLSWIRWASEAWDQTQEKYQEYEDYYLGDHNLEFATDKWKSVFGNVFDELSDNWCQAVVDAAAQRMLIIGWESPDKTVKKQCMEVWDEQGGKLSIEMDDIHTQAFVKGDAYIICWPNDTDPDAGGFDAFYNDALECGVYYDPQNRRSILRAYKRWEDEYGQLHLRLYYPDYVYSYLIPRGIPSSMAGAFIPSFSPLTPEDATMSSLLPSGWEVEQAPLRNPYGVVPVKHFRNRALGSSHGVSELKVVIPVQNAINKLLMDLMVSSEFSGFPQKHIAGAEPKDGWKAGADRIWHSSDPNTKFGEFRQGDLSPFIAAMEMAVSHVAKISQTPMHYLRSSGDMPSGEALKTSESGLVHKSFQRQRQWGVTWSDTMRLILWMKNGSKVTAPITPVWKNPETRHDLEQAQTAQLKALLGVPLEQLWAEHFGYDEGQIEKFQKANSEVLTQALQLANAQPGQTPPNLAQTGLNPTQVMSLIPKNITDQTAAGEAQTKPQPNSRPPGSPTRRSSGFDRGPSQLKD